MTFKETIGVIVAALAVCFVIFWVAIHNDNNFVKDLPTTIGSENDTPTSTGGVDDHQFSEGSWYKLDGVYNVTIGQFGFQMTMSKPRSAEVLDQPGTVVDLTFTEFETGRVTKLTREFVNDPLWFDSSIQKIFEIDEDRTTGYNIPYDETTGSDPLRPELEYSGPGLYFWIYGGLYYYDFVTGNIGLDLPNSP
jgi:hypothetical protein